MPHTAYHTNFVSKHHALCNMHGVCHPTWAELKSHALLELCIVRLCIMRSSTVVILRIQPTSHDVTKCDTEIFSYANNMLEWSGDGNGQIRRS